jgi:beta-ureidopropionase / N-carbamoyl-L-amino-acid hydrolase
MRYIIDINEILNKIEIVANITKNEHCKISRTALSVGDIAARKQIITWMNDAGLKVEVDEIGNIFGTRKGKKDLAPIMFGSHIDTVKNAGKYDGVYGVIAGLELINCFNKFGIETNHPLVLGVFTNEEGIRYTPDMLGSLVYAGGMPVEEAYVIEGIDGSIFGEELKRTGFLGKLKCGSIKPCAFIELHVEQGPILDSENIAIGVVEHLLGISWQEITINGQANHAGTTPMSMRKDAGYIASKINCFVHKIADDLGGEQRATIGKMNYYPDVINVIPEKVVMSVDLRNDSNELLINAETMLNDFIKEISVENNMQIIQKRLARFEPVTYDSGIADIINRSAVNLGYSTKRMTSGAGHDAQMMSRICPAAMIFIPSINGISHNPEEMSKKEDLLAGVEVLAESVLNISNQ